MKKICIYCGSSSGKDPAFKEIASELAKLLVSSNISLIYGGASIGVMGKIADTVLEQGGEVIGVIPQSLVDLEVAHYGLSELKIVKSMHERKSMMAELADGFIAMPGGLGTLEELFEVLTWAQLGFHDKPCGVLNINQYYDGLIQFLDHAVEQGFVKNFHRDMLLVDANPDNLLQKMAEYQPVKVEKWIEYNET